jgi:glycosyltransferase involved in cell wall biosynthesis
MQVTVVVGTYGDADKWVPLARRAARSAYEAGADQVIAIHGETLAEARNTGAQGAAGDHLVFLDADDELDSNYIHAMKEAHSRHMIRSDAWTWLYQPATLGIVDGVPDESPVVIPPRPLYTGNFLVIGTMVSRDLFMKVGGFKEWEAYEDWDLWWRCHREGAGHAVVFDAIYKVHVNPKGRNALPHSKASKVFQQIYKANGGSSG